MLEIERPRIFTIMFLLNSEKDLRYETEITFIIPLLKASLIFQEDLNTFLDEFNHYIFEMVSGDTHAKMGGILAIVALMNADVCNTGTRISR